MPFSKLGLNSLLTQKLVDLQYQKPFPIQQQAIPAILKGLDVVGIAQTGSGKTASYVLPILNNFKLNSEEKNRAITTLILVPTRELAAQVEEVFKVFNSALQNPLKIMSVFGGVSINPQMKALYGIHILIATPGRLLELIEHKALQLNKVSTLVIDEADKMLNLGFKDEMDAIIRLMPAKRQNLLFSATLSDKVKEINQLILHNPIILKISEKDENLDLIQQIAYYVPEEKKGPLLRHILQHENYTQVLIFTSSKFKADNVAKKLQKNGFSATSIHSKKSMGARTKTLEDFKTGKLPILVSTDLLARGIDIAFLPCVINYELPRSPQDFVHRIGRTGRAENPGVAITLFSDEEEQHFNVIQKKMKKRLEVIPYTSIDL